MGVFDEYVDEQVDKKSTIVDFSLEEVEEEEKAFFVACAKQQEWGARRRRAVGKLHVGRAWRIRGYRNPNDYFQEKLGIGKARFHRIVQNYETEQYLIDRLSGFEFFFVKDSFLETLRDFNNGQQLVITQTLQSRSRFFTQKEVTNMAQELGFLRIGKRYAAKSTGQENGDSLILFSLDEEEAKNLHTVSMIDNEKEEVTLRKAVCTYTNDRLKTSK